MVLAWFLHGLLAFARLWHWFRLCGFSSRVVVAWPVEETHFRMENIPILGASVLGTASELVIEDVVVGGQWVSTTAPRPIIFSSPRLSGSEAG